MVVSGWLVISCRLICGTPQMKLEIIATHVHYPQHNTHVPVYRHVCVPAGGTNNLQPIVN